jgi:hypothetical protein
MADHLITAEFPEEEALQRLEDFSREFDALVQRYQLHGAFFQGSVSCRTTPEDPQPGALGKTVSLGCLEHTLAFIARFVALNLEPPTIIQFLGQVQQLHTLKQFNEAMAAGQMNPLAVVPEPEPRISEEDLLNMPMKGVVTKQ